MRKIEKSKLKSKRITLRLTVAEFEELKVYSNETGMSVNDLIRLSINNTACFLSEIKNIIKSVDNYLKTK